MVMTVLTVACSNGLSDYSKQMNPILQEHTDEFLFVIDAYNALIACLDSPAMTECSFDDFATYLDRYELLARIHLEQWVELEPPDEALQFHELVLEVLQLRYHGSRRWKLTIYEFIESPSVLLDEDYLAELESIRELLDRADRLVIRILAESRKLNLGVTPKHLYLEE